MKRLTSIIYRVLSILLTTFGIYGCESTHQYDYDPYLNIHYEETFHLSAVPHAPYCDFSIDYSYLNEEGDSIAGIINRNIQREFLGEDYTSLEPEVAVDSFRNTYLRNYQREIGELYEADKAQANSEEEIPAWYNQTYSMVTFLDEGYNGTMTTSANFYVDSGGAHPNQWSRWINFDFETGKLLTKEEVFLLSAKSDIERILFDHLIHMQAKLHPDETIKTLEDLQKKGFLQMTNIYIPDNFLLRKEGVFFLFNRYDIAPYSAGEIVLEIPYEEIGPYLK